MMNTVQTNLFDMSEYGKLKKKRIHYKTPTYTKFYKNDIQTDGTINNDLCTWGKIKEIYTKIACFFPILFPKEIKEYYDFLGVNPNVKIRVWVTRYQKDTYTYKGQIYTGQEFIVTEAEIIGTEDLSIEERLYLHELLLERLENHDTEPTKGIDNMIERLKRGETLCQLKNSLQI